MPKVTMTRQISGTRNGQHWPKPGDSIDLPAAEAEGLVSLGMATRNGEAPTPRPETRTAEPTRSAVHPPRKPTKPAAARK